MLVVEDDEEDEEDDDEERGERTADVEGDRLVRPDRILANASLDCSSAKVVVFFRTLPPCTIGATGFVDSTPLLDFLLPG